VPAPLIQERCSQRMQELMVSSRPALLAGMVIVMDAAAPQFEQRSGPRFLMSGVGR
jgi:hypothetical protein